MNKEKLNLYTDYLISNMSYATATGLSSMLDGEISHDSVTRFYPPGFIPQKTSGYRLNRPLERLKKKRGV